MGLAVGLTGHTAAAPKDAAAVLDTVAAVLGGNVVLFAHVHAVASSHNDDVNDQGEAEKVDERANEGNDGDNQAGAAFLRRFSFAANGVESQALHDLSHENGRAAECHPPETGTDVTRVKESNLPRTGGGVVVFFRRVISGGGVGRLEGFSLLDATFGDRDCKRGNDKERMDELDEMR